MNVSGLAHGDSALAREMTSLSIGETPKSLFDILPDKLILNCLRCLSRSDLKTTASVNRHFRLLSQESIAERIGNCPAMLSEAVYLLSLAARGDLIRRWLPCSKDAPQKCPWLQELQIWHQIDAILHEGGSMNNVENLVAPLLVAPFLEGDYPLLVERLHRLDRLCTVRTLAAEENTQAGRRDLFLDTLANLLGKVFLLSQPQITQLELVCQYAHLLQAYLDRVSNQTPTEDQATLYNLEEAPVQLAIIGMLVGIWQQIYQEDQVVQALRPFFANIPPSWRGWVLFAGAMAASEESSLPFEGRVAMVLNWDDLIIQEDAPRLDGVRVKLLLRLFRTGISTRASRASLQTIMERTPTSRFKEVMRSYLEQNG